MKISDYDLERLGTTFLWFGAMVILCACALFVSTGAYEIYRNGHRNDAMMKLCEAGRTEACSALGPPGLIVTEKK